MERYTVQVEGCAPAFTCGDDEGVLIAMEKAGHRHVKVGCRRGGCGICKVKVVRGAYHVGKMSRAQVSEREEAEGYALACKLIPESELTLQVCGTK